MTTTKKDEEDSPNQSPFFPSVIPLLFPLWWLFKWFLNKFQTSMEKVEIVVDGIIYGEAPRFHCGRLYFVDFYAQQVNILDIESNKLQKKKTFDDFVSGIGWISPSQMLVVYAQSQKVVLYDENTSKITDYADLSSMAKYYCNDMVVDVSGRAYVGNFGFNPGEFQKTMKGAQTTTVALIQPDGSVHRACNKMHFPNGSVITPDGKTLILAETFGCCLTAFDIEKNGHLSHRRTWAYLGVAVDGICLDAEGCIWVAVPQLGIYPTSGGLLRVREGGEILQILGFGANGIQESVFACNLVTTQSGKHYLYIMQAKTHVQQKAMKNGIKNARVSRIQVQVGPALIPSNSNYSGGYC